MGEDRSAAETDDVDIRPDGAQKEEQGYGDGDVHPEHPLLRVFSIGEAAKEDEEQASEAGDERSWVVAAGSHKSGDSDPDEKNAKSDGEFCHGAGTPDWKGVFRINDERVKCRLGGEFACAGHLLREKVPAKSG